MYAARFLVEKLSPEMCTARTAVAFIPPQYLCVHIFAVGLDGTRDKAFASASPRCAVTRRTEFCAREVRFICRAARPARCRALLNRQVRRHVLERRADHRSRRDAEGCCGNCRANG